MLRHLAFHTHLSSGSFTTWEEMELRTWQWLMLMPDGAFPLHSLHN